MRVWRCLACYTKMTAYWQSTRFCSDECRYRRVSIKRRAKNLPQRLLDDKYVIGDFTLETLSQRYGSKPNTAARAVLRMIKSGLVKRVEPGVYRVSI